MKKPVSCVSITVDESKLKQILDFYTPFKLPSPNEYMLLFAKDEGFVVSVYKPNSKGESKVVFQGPDAQKEVQIWDQNALASAPKVDKFAKPRLVVKSFANVYPQIGSDEVGTGDFFGPVIVAASFLSQDDLAGIKELGITDSKAMDDEYILSIGSKLIHTYDYSELALSPEKFNDVHDEINMNAIKAKMHNRCLFNLSSRHLGAQVYQDQFAEPSLYYSYIKNEKDKVTNIIFSPRGEKAFPSVALASVIARYSFLRKMQKLSEEYHMEFPHGAGDKADAFALEFKEKFGLEEFKKVAKISFANYKKLL
jgi:ribonuclease HIII